MSHFPAKSGESRIPADPGRLTGGLPDVGKQSGFLGSLIRTGANGFRRGDCLKIAFKAPSLR
jgi:hypothetical protein